MVNLASISTIHNQPAMVNGIPPWPVAGTLPPPIDPMAVKKIFGYAIRGIFHALLIPVAILTGCGSKVEELIRDLKDKKPSVRAFAAEQLSWMGPAAVDAVPALIEALKDSDQSVSFQASEALKKIRGY